jgi:hypothetical protein
MRETGQGVQTSAGLDVEELATRKESEFSNPLSSFRRFLSVLISVHLWFQTSSESAASASRPRVWWLGQKRSAALNGGATGGMSADILLAHGIAAAKVRRQSLS